MAKAKYSNGTKVRITQSGTFRGNVNLELQSYDNQVGEIMNSIPVLGFLIPQPWASGSESLGYTLHYYEIRLDDNTILRDVSEDYLEEIKGPISIPA